VDQQKETLQRELKVCQDLLAIEPNSKCTHSIFITILLNVCIGAILTITFLELKLVSLGERQHTDDIQRNLKQLTEINPYHSQFYEHLARFTHSIFCYCCICVDTCGNSHSVVNEHLELSH
jgi:hypothetical protein